MADCQGVMSVYCVFGGKMLQSGCCEAFFGNGFVKFAYEYCISNFCNAMRLIFVNYWIIKYLDWM